MAFQGNQSEARRPRSLWHESFYECAIESAPNVFEIHYEVPLSRRSRKVDLLVVRRIGRRRGEQETRLLRSLWPLLPDITLIEFKSPSAEVRRGDLVKLLSYGAQYHSQNIKLCPQQSSIALVLITPRYNTAVASDLDSLGAEQVLLTTGYFRVIGLQYRTYIVYTDEASEADDDDRLRVFSHHPVRKAETIHWMRDWITRKRAMPGADTKIEEHDIFRKFLYSLPVDERLTFLTTEERLLGLKPEERLAGLRPEVMLPALPTEILRSLSPDYIAELPRSVQAAIARRLAGNDAPTPDQ